MQRLGPPKQGGHGDAAKAAIQRIVSVVENESSSLPDEHRLAVVTAADKIASRFMFDTDTITRTKKSYCPAQNQFERTWDGELDRAGRELSVILREHVPRLLSLGLTGAQIGNAAFKLTFEEIQTIFSDPILYKDNALKSGRVDALLNCINPRELFARLKATYAEPALSDLEFNPRLFLVLNPDLANERVAFARNHLQAGGGTGMLAAYATATEEQIQWFDAVCAQPDFANAADVLIRVAKQAPAARNILMTHLQELLRGGIVLRDAVNLVLAPDYENKVRKAALVALDLGLTSTAVSTFALSKKGQDSPTLLASDIRTLRQLPLDWSDEMIMRIVVGGVFYRARPGSSPIQSREELCEGLRWNVEHSFKIDRRDPKGYAVRRLIGQLTMEQTVTFFGVFFNSRDFPGLKDTLLKVGQADRVSFTRVCNVAKDTLRELGADPGKKSVQGFSDLCFALSDFLLSVNEGVRGETQQLLYSWVINHAKRYYPSYMKIRPEVVGEIIDGTIRNYDPKSEVLGDSAGRKSRTIGIYEAFAGNVRHFFSHLIKYELRESPAAIRAYKMFVDRHTESRRTKRDTSDSEVWQQMAAERSDLIEGITEAQMVMARVQSLHREHQQQGGA